MTGRHPERRPQTLLDAAACALGSVAGKLIPIVEGAQMRRIIVAAAVACGLLAVPLTFAPQSAAACDSADCLPGVARNVVAGTPCTPSTTFVFGLTADKSTLICSAHAVWVPTGPLLGEAAVSLPCAVPGTNGQIRLSGNTMQPQTPGIPVQCVGPVGASTWVHFDPPA